MERLSDLRYRHARAWVGLAQQPFLMALRDGMVSLRAIRRWLAQDYMFLEGLMGFQADLLYRAPQSHRPILTLAVISTVRELDWLNMQDLDLAVRPHPAVTHYLSYLQELEAQPYSLAIVMHWVLYRVFFDTWFSAKPQDGPLAEFSELWSTPELQALQRDLSGLAVEMMAQADPAELDRLIERALELERQSWKMAWEFVQKARPTLI
ncbi:transcriptional activator, TenA family [Allomeiothermus silvanus DSM 9946]|uniref:Transcriptional activator, TenA family n=1 Tax=Allomeiothermus silvanus (strain ATCC 700542 / DSM 9946 / NBRC 106475 / NCIMB 13440 / VI-R2) TaxID=526227 RepID=D7BBU3_ALLS1|nr:TenA family transcriptional activator [Allomeiothermus silvanus]ADH62739.1 transcriptional activator, TenA family [Allomeiothermus silvanus DSM 9946]